MKTLREQFEDNYRAAETPCGNKKGFRITYIYYGPWYRWELDARTLRRVKWLIGILYFGSLGVFLSCALFDTVLNYGIVGLPVGLTMAGAVFTLIGVIRFLSTGPKFTRIRYRDIDFAFKLAVPIHILLAFVSFCVSVYVWTTEKLSLSQAAPAFGYLAAALCLAAMELLYKHLHFRTEENTAGMPVSAKGRNSL